MRAREEALQTIARLAREHDIGADEIASRLAAGATDAEQESSLLGRILAYLGGIFVFAGLGVFIAINWDALNTAARIVVSLGSGLAALIMAIVAVGDDRYRRAATPLFLIAAALQPTGLLITMDELSTGGEWRHAVLLTCAVMVLQQGAIFLKHRRPVLLFTTIAFALWFYGTALDLFGMHWSGISLLLGGSVVGLCTGLERTAYRDVTPFYYFIGGIGAYGGLFDMVEGTPIELVFLLAACGGLFLSGWVRRRTLLIVSTLAILVFVSYFTAEHFVDSIGWPVALIALGIVLLLLSALALRINRDYIRAGPAPG